MVHDAAVKLCQAVFIRRIVPLLANVFVNECPRWGPNYRNFYRADDIHPFTTFCVTSVSKSTVLKARPLVRCISSFEKPQSKLKLSNRGLHNGGDRFQTHETENCACAHTSAAVPDSRPLNHSTSCRLLLGIMYLSTVDEPNTFSVAAVTRMIHNMYNFARSL